MEIPAPAGAPPPMWEPLFGRGPGLSSCLPLARLGAFGHFTLAKGTVVERFCALDRPANARDLILGPFFHQNLARIGQTRQSMFDTDATCYAETVLWAAAVHESFPHLMVWSGRRTSTIAISRPGRARIGAFAWEYEIDIVPA